ncbi:hypothetical protein QYM36_012634 [Artemia franciscana]|uniref:RanBP2-type domain-containing protein n=1 Tax=Artemia franciscana TaxID=6661 RepID=A0AA88L090_ARTSF|nr:hypothetical protein QYM36_012634 [Artemia franciscana]
MPLLEVSALPKIISSAPLKPFILGFEHKAATVQERNEDCTDFKHIETVRMNDDQFETLVSTKFKFDECPSLENPTLSGQCFLPNMADIGKCVASTSSKHGSMPLVLKQHTILVSSVALNPKPGSWICPGCRVSNEEYASNCVSCSVSKLEAVKPSQGTISSSEDVRAKAASASENEAAPFQFGVPTESQDSDKVLQENGNYETISKTISCSEDIRAKAASASANVTAPLQFRVSTESQDSDNFLQENEIHNFKRRVPATPTKNIFVNPLSGANAKPTKVLFLSTFLKTEVGNTQEIKVSEAGKNANINKKSLKRFKPSVIFEIPGKQVKLQEKETFSSQNHLQDCDCENPFGGMRSSWNVEGSEECEKNFRLGANTKSSKVGVDTSNRKCYKCQSFNHLMAECPSRICYSCGKRAILPIYVLSGTISIKRVPLLSVRVWIIKPMYVRIVFKRNRLETHL